MSLIDARRLPAGHSVSADVCVIGGGPAGIVVARGVARRGLRVVLLESGGLEPEPAVQALAEGRSIGRPYWSLASSRLRALGGTTGHWTGWCRPLDETDFGARAWVENAEWPIAYRSLVPYYRAAQKLCELGPFDYSPAAWSKRLSLPLLDLDGAELETVFWQFSPPTRFGRRYRDELERSNDVQVYLYANATEFAQGTAAGVERLRAATLEGGRFDVRAGAYVLATGGLENPRLMLASPGRSGLGLGNDHGLVGACFCEHLHTRVGLVLCDRRTLGGYDNLVHTGNREPVGVRASIALSPELQRREGLMNLCVNLEPTGGTRPYRQRHLDGVGALLRQLHGARDAVVMELFVRAEQEPTAESRVVLGRARDALGLPLIELDWQPSEKTLDSVQRAVAVLAREFGRSGFGRVFSYAHAPVNLPSAWPQVTGGHHHMGTTRMHPDPRYGVVDSNCRVHGVPNLFVAGSSVFPSVGYANPTLTLVALAARLSDYLVEHAA
jgi:choline dehydrogenase-like flavoprotein